MNVGTVIRKKREEAGLTQAALARRLGVSESTLRLYELGIKNVPHDVANVAAATLRAPEICLAKCGECPTNWLRVSLLDVDSHPNTEVIAVIQEAEEAVRAVQGLQLRNGHLNQDQRPALERAIDQVLDLIPLAATAVSAWCRTYGLDMREMHEKHLRKLISRGYIKEEEAA